VTRVQDLGDGSQLVQLRLGSIRRISFGRNLRTSFDQGQILGSVTY
jgi:hypothetical protein